MYYLYIVIYNIKKTPPKQPQNSLKFTKSALGSVSAAVCILLHTPFFALALVVTSLLGTLVQSTNPAESYPSIKGVRILGFVYSLLG